MAWEIPLTGDARQRFATTLDGLPVEVVAWWQPSDRHWYLSLATASGEAIVSGVRLVGGGLPLRDFSSVLYGGLYVSGDDNLERDAWSRGTHHLLYLTPDELPP